MARSVSRKSTKKCGPRRHARKAHMRGGKRIKATCIKNRRRTMKSIKVSMRAMKSKTRSKTASRKSKSKTASRKSKSKSGSRRVLGSGACTSRKISECTNDFRCQIRRRPSGGKTCVLGKGWKKVHGEFEHLAMIGAY